MRIPHLSKKDSMLTALFISLRKYEKAYDSFIERQFCRKSWRTRTLDKGD